jgi:amino acid transporter
MTNLLTWSFWLTLSPESLTPLAQKIFIGFLIFLAASAILVALIKRRGSIYRGFFKKLYGFLLGNAVIGLIFFFFNYEMVPFFSARFWLAIWALVMIVWLFFIIKKLKVIPRQKKEQTKNEELKKYLP